PSCSTTQPFWIGRCVTGTTQRAWYRFIVAGKWCCRVCRYRAEELLARGEDACAPMYRTRSAAAPYRSLAVVATVVHGRSCPAWALFRGGRGDDQDTCT